MSADLAGTVAALKAQGKTIRDIERQLGISFYRARMLYHQGGPAGVPEPAPEPDPVDRERERIERTRSLRAEREQLQAVAGERSLRAFLETAIGDAAAAFPPPTPYRPPAETPGTTTEQMLLFLSDWHAYETIAPERTLGLGGHDADRLGRKVRRVVDSAIRIKGRLERGGWRFPSLAVALGGDMISGSIHETERHSDAPNVVQAAWGCGLLLAHALRDLAAHFGEVHCVGVVGNHGRLPDARRVQQKDPTRSWDWLIYQVARLSLRDVPWITWQLPEAYSAIFDLAGWGFYLNHGHEIKSTFSIPFYGIDRKVRNLRGVLERTGRSPDYYLFAHFHSPGGIRNYVVNGSLQGPSEFGVEGLGVADPPSQWLFGVHPDHGLTHRWELHSGPGVEGPSYPVRPWLD